MPAVTVFFTLARPIPLDGLTLNFSRVSDPTTTLKTNTQT